MQGKIKLTPVCWAAFSLLILAPPSSGVTVSFDEPSLDRWFHQGEVSPGTKTDPSLFTGFADPGTDFEAVGQARSGTMLIGFDISNEVPQVLPGRYKLDSISVTATITPDFSVQYDPTADLVDDIINQTDDAGRPIELFGVGYDNDYEQLGFGPNDGQFPEFEESSPPYASGATPEERTFNVFPLGDDGTGTDTMSEVFNSPTGIGSYAFNSETEEWELQSILKDAWDPTPWAVGMIDGLSPGDDVPGNSEFRFDVNLSLPGVLEHFQSQLSRGQLGVFLTSMHDVSGFHSGGGFNPFPKFYAKEHPFVINAGASAATLDIEFSIANPGDTDYDCDVDITDFNTLSSHFSPSGTGVVMPWTHGNFDADDDIDITDFNALSANFAPNGYGAEHAAVPEPLGAAVLCGLCICLWFDRSHRPGVGVTRRAVY